MKIRLLGRQLPVCITHPWSYRGMSTFSAIYSTRMLIIAVNRVCENYFTGQLTCKPKPCVRSRLFKRQPDTVKSVC